MSDAGQAPESAAKNRSFFAANERYASGVAELETYRNIRVLISLDPSDDGTDAVCAPFLADPRFTLIRQPAPSAAKKRRILSGESPRSTSILL